MRVHEIHPSIIHGPLVLLPTAAVVDLVAASTREPALERLGRQFWLAGTVSGVLAGLAGLAASQEVKAEEKTTRDALILHGLLNLGIVVSGLGVTLWRRTHRASALASIVSLGASGLAFYSAYLGGELVYGRGVGVKLLKDQPLGEEASPPILSRQAPRAFFRDAARGAAWLMGHGWRLLRGEERLEREALAPPEAAQPSAPMATSPMPRLPSDDLRPFGG